MVRLEQIHVSTRGAGDFAELTPEVDRIVRGSGVREGVALVRSRHTTAAIACNEPDPRLHADMMAALRETFPVDRPYGHIEEGPENAVAHLGTALMFGESTWLPVRDGRLDVGTWQHVYLVELLEPRRRDVDVAILGD